MRTALSCPLGLTALLCAVSCAVSPADETGGDASGAAEADSGEGDSSSDSGNASGDDDASEQSTPSDGSDTQNDESNEDDSDDGSADSSAGEETDASESESESSEAEDGDTGKDAPTWHADIRPMLEQACTRCHKQGGIAPFDFRKRDEVEILAGVMAELIDAGEMPPPVSDPDCRDYHGSDRLRADEGASDLLRAWLEAGTPEGDPADTPELPPEIDGDLANPDLELRFRSPHVPQFGGSLGDDNEYACLVLEDSGLDQTYFVTAMAPLVDHHEVVHHIVLHRLPRSQVPEGQDQLDGIRCAGLGAPEARREGTMLAAWAPGMLPIEFPDNMGLRVGPDDVLVVQMHYFRSGTDVDELPDHSGYAFRIADARPYEIAVETMGPSRFNIPANAEAHEVKGSESVAANTLYLGAFPHMHVLGSGYTVSLRGQGGQDGTCLARSTGYDFDNQLTYMFREPFLVPANTQMDVSCIYNNSPSNPDLIHNPPIDTGFGLKTDDEMCFSFNLVVHGYDGG